MNIKPGLGLGLLAGSWPPLRPGKSRFTLGTMAKDDVPSCGASPPRNFTLSVADRMRALAAGPPAFSRRLRRIEDLTAAIVSALEACAPVEVAALPERIRRDVARLNGLIDDHNRYYPIEARLPMDVRTAQRMDLGEPWTPMPHVTIEALLSTLSAVARSGSSSGPGAAWS